MIRLIFILVMLLTALAAAADQMYFTMTGPPGAVGLQPYTVTIYTVDTVAGKLVEIWDFGARPEFPRVKTYSSSRLTTVEVGYADEGECFWMWWDSVGQLYSAEAVDSNISYFGNLLEAPSGLLLQTLVMRPDGPPQLKLLDLSTKAMRAPVKPIRLSDMRLAGPEPGGNIPSSTLQVDIDSGGNVVLEDSTIISDLPPIPDSIITQKDSYGWTIIANEESYLVVISAPYEKGQSHKELLIYSRSDRKWRSLLIPGVQTLPRLFGNRLAGVIADESPDVNYETRASGPPVLREEAVIINPLEASCFSVTIGREAAVLWVDSINIFYRAGLTIYRGRIENNAIAERKALVTDRPVYGIKRAFPGSTHPPR